MDWMSEQILRRWEIMEVVRAWCWDVRVGKVGFVRDISVREDLRAEREVDIRSRLLEREARFSACWARALESCLETVSLANSMVLRRSWASERVSLSIKACLLARRRSSRS